MLFLHPGVFFSQLVSASLCPIPIQKLDTNLLCSCARGLVGEWRRTSSTACSRWKVAVPAHTRYTAPEPLSTGQSELPNKWAHSTEGIWICREFGCEKRQVTMHGLVPTFYFAPSLFPAQIFWVSSHFATPAHLPHMLCPRSLLTPSWTAGGSRLLRPPHGEGCRASSYK